MISKSFKVGSSLFIIILLFMNFMSSYNSIEVNSQKVLGINNDYDYLDSLYNFESDNSNFADNNNNEHNSFLVEKESEDDGSSNRENVHSIDKYYIVKEHEIIDEEKQLDNSNITSNSTHVISQNNTDAADVKEIIDILSSNQISELIKALKNDSLISQDSIDNSSYTNVDASVDESDDFIEVIQTAAGEEIQAEKINNTDRNITVNLYGDGDAYIYQEKGGNLRKIQFNRIKEEELIEEKEVKEEDSLTNTEEIEADSLDSKEKIEILNNNEEEDELDNTLEIDDTNNLEDTEYENEVDDEDIDYIFSEYDEDIEYDD